MKKYILLSLALVLALFLQSCLKEKGFDSGEYGGKGQDSPGVGFGQGRTDSTGSSFAIGVSSTPLISTDLEIDLEGTSPLSKDITITFAQNPGLLTSPNAVGLVPLTPSQFSIPTSAIIKAGQQFVRIPVTLNNTSILSISSSYAIGLTITGVSDGLKINKAKKDIIMKINVKNQYDGNYHGQGYFYHPSAPRVIDDNFNLVTIGANTVRTNLGDLGNQIVLTVDASNNVTVTDFGAIVGLTPTATILNLPPPYSPFPGSVASIYNNTYNPTTHQFFLRYGYMGGSGPRVVEEILTLN